MKYFVILEIFKRHIHGGFPQPVASIKILLSDWDVFEKSQAWKTRQEGKTLTFLMSIIFKLKNYDVKSFHRRASINVFFIEPKISDWRW